MKWKVLVMLGAAAGAVAYVAHRRNQRAVGVQRWREVTDPVARVA